MPPAIQVENLGKCYRVQQQKRGGYRTLRESLVDMAAAPLRRWRDGASSPAEEFWALKDISFEVERGDVVGIVGRNGAGKSTLLKILSRITKPTSGRALLRGRVGSLLEVGTGFHPELTGRENIFLNGSIVGMSRREILRKFDTIVDFSGVGPFLDTPVKRYSSGMYVRLAFAVASHLDLEILVVDEVLAVGDLAFQKKCLGKMKEVTEGGRTVLFVSHNMAAVRALCRRGILLDGGCVRDMGDVEATIRGYIQAQLATEEGAVVANLPRFSRANDLALTAASLRTNDSDLVLSFTLESTRRHPLLGVGFAIRSDDGTLLASQPPIFTGVHLADVAGTTRANLRIRDVLRLLNGGGYLLDLWFSYPGVETLIRVDGLMRFEAPEQDPYVTGHALTQQRNGPCCLTAVLDDARCEAAAQ